MSNCINSSKVYCKFASDEEETELTEVLIVAKCIVNPFRELYKNEW